MSFLFSSVVEIAQGSVHFWISPSSKKVLEYILFETTGFQQCAWLVLNGLI